MPITDVMIHSMLTDKRDANILNLSYVKMHLKIAFFNFDRILMLNQLCFQQIFLIKNNTITDNTNSNDSKKSLSALTRLGFVLYTSARNTMSVVLVVSTCAAGAVQKCPDARRTGG